MSSTCPVMKLAEGEARKTTPAAISCGSPIRPSGVACYTASMALSGIPSVIRVRVKPGRHGVDGNALAGILASQRLGQADHAGLGGRVIRLPKVADLAGHARHVDDPAPPAIGHPVDEVLGDQEDTGQVGGDDLVPGRFASFS